MVEVRCPRCGTILGGMVWRETEFWLLVGGVWVVRGTMVCVTCGERIWFKASQRREKVRRRARARGRLQEEGEGGIMETAK